MPFIALLDLESVLIPELWPILAKELGVKELELTTRQVADKKALNDLRLKALKKSGVTVAKIEKLMAKVKPLSGAPEFLKWLSARMPFVVVTDCFRGLAAPVLQNIGVHGVVAHDWVIKKGKVSALPLRAQGDTKAPVAEAFKALGFTVVAVGDSLNDVGMLKAADLGLFYKPSPRAEAAAPKIKACKSYAEVKKAISKIL